MPNLKWELITNLHMEYLAKVPGGWLHKKEYWINVPVWNMSMHAIDTSVGHNEYVITFIPDPDHTWEMLDLLHKNT